MVSWWNGNGRNAMNGIKFLLDTNYILGLVKGQSEVIADIQQRGADWRWYGFSSISRMECLGFPLNHPGRGKSNFRSLGKAPLFFHYVRHRSNHY
ncbi:hypothetical protein MTYM_01229 [Methylococcales bacterium]|nr:hypothetical protein MTYM_01229 [Methylococcales bacterium]